MHLPFPISISVPTSTKEISEMSSDQISTQHSLWKLLYFVIELGFGCA